MAKTTGALAFSAVMNFRDIAQMLDYCKKHSSEETYTSVIKSFKKTVISILIILLVLILVFAGGMLHFGKEIDSKITANNVSYSFEKTGHVGNGVVWYIDNVKYEIDISDFGYDINDFEEKTDFRIYLDDAHRVVDISPVTKGNTASDKMLYWIIGSMISMCAVLITFTIWMRYSKSKLNPMREYYSYVKWFRNKAENEAWYNG